MRRFVTFLWVWLLCCHALWAQTAAFQQLMRNGDSLRNVSRFEKALNCYELAEAMVAQQLPSRKAVFWLHRADCYKQIGEYGKAMVCYDRLEELGPRFAKREDVVLNKSDVLLLTGRYERAVELLEPLQCAVEAGGTKRLVNLASAYEWLGMKEKALALLDDVKHGHTADKDATYAIATNNKGYVLWAMRRYEEAAGELREAMELFSPSEAKYYQTLGNLALVEAEMGSRNEALAHIDECIAWVAANCGLQHPDYVACLRKRAEILLKTREKRSALDAFRQFFSAAKRDVVRRFAYMSTQERQNYWAMMRPLVAECFALEETDPDFLYDVAVFSKSVLLQANSDFLQMRGADAQSMELFERIRCLQRQAANSSGEERRLKEDSIERLERRLLAASTVYRQYTRNLNAGSSMVRRGLRKTSDVAVEFVRYRQGDTTRYAALVMPKKGKVRFVRLPSQDELEGYSIQSRTLRELLLSNSKNDKRLLYEDRGIADLIWKEVLQGVPADADVWFASEGLLNILAIEYLNMQPRSGHLYRLSATRALVAEKKGHPAQRGILDRVLLIGGIDYDDDAETETVANPLPDRYGSRLFFEERGISGQHVFSYLPGSKRETMAIASALEGCRVTADSLAHVPEERVKAEMGNYTAVHISTHGYAWQLGNTQPPHAVDSVVEDKSLWRSFIALSGANEVAQPAERNRQREDGLLTSKELSEMDLSNVSLVVMAACQTGLGRTTDDGLVGIPLGLKRAGAGAVVVSLWEVNDEATQCLMTFFYRNLRSGKFASVTDAFNDAREQLRSYRPADDDAVRSRRHSASKASFHPGTMSGRSRKNNRPTSFDHPFYYNPFIVIDGF